MLWPLKKDKSPGFGIASDFYLTVLAARADLPSPSRLLHPKGEGGRVAGFIAPLDKEATKEDLERPLQAGHYVIASLDKKTVLQLTIVPKEHVQYDPEAVIRTLGSDLSPETAQRMRATWNLLQLTIKSFHRSVYPTLNFLLLVAQKLGYETDGVIADPLSEAYRLPQDLIAPPNDPLPFATRDFVRIKIVDYNKNTRLHTLGMVKFALPELEIVDVPESHSAIAVGLLYSLATYRLTGQSIEPGNVFGDRKHPLRVAHSADSDYWQGRPALELIPDNREVITETLDSWHRIAEEQSRR